MAWYPGARKMELQPESDAQAAIKPTQFIVHSIAAPWTVQRIFEYWRDSTNLESHFGLAYDGDLGQFIGTETRADANAGANGRAVSIETASNLNHTDPWTDQQVDAIVRLGVWLHQRHGLPLRLCRTSTDPGYGWHGMFSEWSLGGTACPGAARIKQFKEVVFPEIVRRASGAPSKEEDDMTPQDLINAKMPMYAELEGGYVPTVGEVWNGSKETDRLVREMNSRLDGMAREVIDAVKAAIASGEITVTYKN